ncbi:MAG: hypothetical protein WDM90_15575 [Ferruginibacter sp.]
MKKTILYLMMAVATTSCNSNETTTTTKVETNEKNSTTSFTVDGVTIKGDVSTQYFGSNKETDNFSVLCQQDEPLVLLQATFASEKDATNSGLKPKGFDGYKVDIGQFSLTLTPAGHNGQFVATDKTEGAIKIENNKIVINNMKLYNREGKETVVSGTIVF